MSDSSLSSSAIHPSSLVEEGASIAPNVKIGPFSRVRPGTVLSKGTRIGNFVEIKKSKVGRDSKINHLSYVGD